jgi:hypothetical protein
MSNYFDLGRAIFCAAAVMMSLNIAGPPTDQSHQLIIAYSKQIGPARNVDQGSVLVCCTEHYG